MQPIDYRIAVRDPVQMALAGYQQGQQFKLGQAEMANAQLEGQKVQLEIGALEEKQARAQETQAALGMLAEKARTGTLTARDIFEMNTRFPEIGEHVNKSFEAMSEAEVQGSIKELARTTIAFSRAPEVGMQLLDERIAAAEESGLTDAVAGLKAMRKIAETDPAAAVTSGFATLGTVMEPKQFESFMAVAQPASKATEAFQTLQLRAAAAGLQPGTPEYQRFMENGGAERGPLVVNNLGDGNLLRTGPLAPETGLMDDPNAPGGVRIVPLQGGSAATQKENAIATADELISTLEAFKASPGAKSRYGLASVGGVIPAIPGSDAANAQALINKVKGSAFLQAFESLKGAGQITEVEGNKGAQAITILNDQNISWDAAVRAADDLIRIVKAAKLRKATTDQQGAAPAPTGGEMPIVRTDDEFEALPKGTRFKDEAGNIYRKD